MPLPIELYNQEAEESVLGGILIDPKAIARVAYRLTPEHFHFTENQTLFSSCLELFQRGSSVDLVAVTTALRESRKFDLIGGSKKMSQLIDGVVSSVNIDKYAELIIEKWRWRQLAAATTKAQQVFADRQIEPTKKAYTETLESLKSDLVALQGLGANGGVCSAAELASKLFNQIEARIENPDLLSESFLSSGFADFDRRFLGLPVGVTILAGRPAMGKTALGLNMALRAARRGKSVLIFSIEMTQEQLGIRLISSLSGIDSQRLERGAVEPCENADLISSIETLATLPLDIDESSTSLEDIIAVTENWRLKNGRSPDLVVVDFLQLIELNAHHSSEQERVGKIASNLGSYFTKTAKTSCLLLSQLNRGVEQRTEKRPKMSDIRDSGKVEEAGGLMLGIYRDSYYNESALSDETELIVLKNRFGPVGKINLNFALETSTFYDTTSYEQDFGNQSTTTSQASGAYA